MPIDARTRPSPLDLHERGSSWLAQRSDVLAMDTFSAVAIAIHLMTVEEKEAGRSHPQEKAVLACQVNNRQTDPLPVAQPLAEAVVLTAVDTENASDSNRAAEGVLIFRSEESLPQDSVHEDEWPEPPAGPILTAAFNSLFAVVGLDG